MVAKEYLGLLHPTCVFHNWVRDEKAATESDTVCGQPAVAVYVSDDAEPQGRYVCEAHAKDAEINGDGPVFWQREAKPPKQSARDRMIADAKRHGINVAHTE